MAAGNQVGKLRLRYDPIADPSHSQSKPREVTVDLPVDGIPQVMQDRWRRFDKNHDGILSVNVNRDSLVGTREISNTDETFSELTRSLWRFQGRFPSNLRQEDLQTENVRVGAVFKMQDQINTGLVSEILRDFSKIQSVDALQETAMAARRALELTADYRHLLVHGLDFFAEAQKIFNQGEWMTSKEASDRGYALAMIAEDYLMTSMLKASGIEEARRTMIDEIESKLDVVSRLCQKFYDQRHAQLISKPYLMAATGSPVLSSVEEIEKNKTVLFEVGVPESFIEEAKAKNISVPQAIHDFFEMEQLVSLRQSYLGDQRLPISIRLYPDIDTIEYDYAGFGTKPEFLRKNPSETDDDPIGKTFSPHLDQASLKRTVFKGQKTHFYRVGFHVKHHLAFGGDMVTDEYGSPVPMRKFDVLIDDKTQTKEVPGGFVARRNNVDYRAGVFSDPHVQRDDWKKVRHITLGLLQKRGKKTTGELDENDQKILQEVDRFYEQINNQLLLYIEQGQKEFRAGKRHFDICLGDITDYTNIALTLQSQGYHLTNVRLFNWLWSHYEGILFSVSGNHDTHGIDYPDGESVRNFTNVPSMSRQWLRLGDQIRFKDTFSSITDGLKTLFPKSFSAEEEHSALALGSYFLESVHAPTHDTFPDDDFLAPMNVETVTYSSYSLNMGNGHRLFFWPTGSEDFQFLLALLRDFPDPLGPNVSRGFSTYIGDQHANGKGPPLDIILALINEVEQASSISANEVVTLAGHFPAFFEGTDPSTGLADAEDTLQYQVALIVRLIQWYFKNASGETTLKLAIAGHVHAYSETEFVIDLRNKLDEQFVEVDDDEKSKKNYADFKFALKGIFDRALGRAPKIKFPDGTDKNLFDEIFELSRDWDLPKRFKVNRVNKAGFTQGFPGSLVKDLNAGKQAHPLSLTAFALAPDRNGSGYLAIEFKNGKKYKVDSYRLRETQDGRIISASTERLADFEGKVYQEEVDWDKNFSAQPRRDAWQGEDELHPITRANLCDKQFMIYCAPEPKARPEQTYDDLVRKQRDGTKSTEDAALQPSDKPGFHWLPVEFPYARNNLWGFQLQLKYGGYINAEGLGVKDLALGGYFLFPTTWRVNPLNPTANYVFTGLEKRFWARDQVLLKAGVSAGLHNLTGVVGYDFEKSSPLLGLEYRGQPPYSFLPSPYVSAQVLTRTGETQFGFGVSFGFSLFHYTTEEIKHPVELK